MTHKRHYIYFGVLAIVVGGIIGAAIGMSMKNKRSRPPAQKNAITFNAIKLGSYDYVNTCQAFSAQDVKDVAGKDTDATRVGATFAYKVAPAQIADTAVDSECIRTEASSDKLAGLDKNYYSLNIRQYDTPKYVEQFRQSDLATQDASLVPQFGNGVTLRDSNLAGTTSKLTFYVDNKIVSVTAGNLGKVDAAAFHWFVAALAVKVSARLHDNNVKSADFRLSPPGAKVDDFLYRQACELLPPEDFAAATKKQLDASKVTALFAENIAGNSNVISKCELQSDDDIKNQLAVRIDTSQSGNIESAQARYDHYPEKPGTPITGMGDQAQLLTNYLGAEVLLIRKNNLQIEVKLPSFTGTKEASHTILRDIGAKIHSRLSR